jgi:hypothetical protein
MKQYHYDIENHVVDSLSKEINDHITKTIILIGRYDNICKKLNIPSTFSFNNCSDLDFIEIEKEIERMETLYKLNNL